ncbi:MAG: hypothetical protein HWQ38_16400 [Nostoc sp. NMS7]|uniref:hypothetical protein n=1 Tax=Nostoc sp. NMS7 TaxID=2815391 RepID=UPI0025D3153F|nr:hypothetical protein [Nostoc sp. NMS7]MBN3947951.1 hypothetical protein [Nostoc sp. NMS7]
MKTSWVGFPLPAFIALSQQLYSRGKTMQRYILPILSALLISPVLATTAEAQTSITYNSVVANSAKASQINPFNLAFMAERGYLKNVGIKSGNALLNAHQSGMLTAKDILQSAVKAKLLPEQTLSDQGYLNALEAQLQALEQD